MSAPLTLPGFSTPAAGFDEPMAMLLACHERVRRSLTGLGRIAERAAQGRVDAAVREAARDVLRYFDVAAPHHHEDEERHVFPLVLSSCGDAALRDAVHTLERQHVELRALWSLLRGPLEALAEGGDEAFDAPARDTAAQFIAVYERHAAIEETTVFPFAAARLDADALACIGAEMAARRGARVVPGGALR
jgi:hemerythrin-like domain-containing protein